VARWSGNPAPVSHRPRHHAGWFEGGARVRRTAPFRIPAERQIPSCQTLLISALIVRAGGHKNQALTSSGGEEEPQERCPPDVSSPKPFSLTAFRLDDAARSLGLSRDGLKRALVRCGAETISIGPTKFISPEELARVRTKMGRFHLRAGQRIRGPNGRFIGAPP
jgi:hypothetical protein